MKGKKEREDIEENEKRRGLSSPNHETFFIPKNVIPVEERFMREKMRQMKTRIWDKNEKDEDKNMREKNERKIKSNKIANQLKKLNHQLEL